VNVAPNNRLENELLKVRVFANYSSLAAAISLASVREGLHTI
jgi:hypothetical protein